MDELYDNEDNWGCSAVASKVCAIEMFSTLSEMESWGWCILFYASILILGLIRHVVVTFIVRFVACLDIRKIFNWNVEYSEWEWMAGKRRSSIELCSIWQSCELNSNRNEDLPFAMSNWRGKIKSASTLPKKNVPSTTSSKIIIQTKIKESSDVQQEQTQLPLVWKSLAYYSHPYPHMLSWCFAHTVSNIKMKITYS